MKLFSKDLLPNFEVSKDICLCKQKNEQRLIIKVFSEYIFGGIEGSKTDQKTAPNKNSLKI